MPIPTYQQVMLPVLQLVSDNREHKIADIVPAIGEKFHLSEAELQDMLPSGQQTRLANRIYWAGTYLVKAGLLTRPSRGNLLITDEGKRLLATNPQSVDISVLEQYASFNDFRLLRGTRASERSTDQADEVSVDTPEDLVAQGYAQLRQTLASDLIEKVKACTPRFFEKLVVELLVAMGYGGSREDAGKAVGQSGDGGIDGIIKEDRLGLDAVYIQAKRWDGPVGRPVVQGFSGSLDGRRARRGVLITTSRFTDDAKEYVQLIEKKIVLIDGEQLAQLMIDYGVGVAVVSSYTVNRLDADYFEE